MFYLQQYLETKTKQILEKGRTISQQRSNISVKKRENFSAGLPNLIGKYVLLATIDNISKQWKTMMEMDL